MKNIQKTIKEWKKEAKVESPVLFKVRTLDNKTTLCIYTTRPGYLIGRAGKLFYKYKDILTGNSKTFGQIDDVTIFETEYLWA